MTLTSGETQDAQEMEALVHLTYEKEISDYVNTTPLASLNRDTALQ